MKTQLYKKYYLFYLLIILCSLAISNSRVAYSRPGSVIRTPGKIQAELFNQYIGGWDVSNVKKMTFMFYYAIKFNQSLNNWDVSNVKYMYSIFSGAESFNQSSSIHY